MIWGIPRRVYRDGLNVRVEHWRHGAVVEEDHDAFELPDYLVKALRWYALWQCTARPGPGQDLKLSEHFQSRYQRMLERIQRRLKKQTQARTIGFGDGRPAAGHRPPRPSWPWNYGARVR